MAFSYQALRNDEVRLLEVRSSNPPALEFTVRHYPRQTVPSYVAISYTWGESPATEEIILDGQHFPVRPNLWSCLHHMQRCPEWSLIWIDAVCIDQSNIRERNDQVRVMDEIYTRAETVVAWLGHEDESADCSHVPEAVASELKYWDEEYHIRYFDLVNRPYWTRRWVVQELSLARSIVFLCGQQRIPWDDLQAPFYVSSDGSGKYSGGKGGMWYKRVELQPYAKAYTHMLDRSWSNSGNLLHQLVRDYSHTECRDPRDRVFALLSLVKPRDRKSLETWFPDYTMNEETVQSIALAHSLHASRLEKSFLGRIIYGLVGKEDILTWQSVWRAAVAFYCSSEFAAHDHGGPLVTDGTIEGVRRLSDEIEASWEDPVFLTGKRLIDEPTA